MTDNFTVMLSCPPAVGSTVDVTVASTMGQVSAAPATVSFTNANWNTPQTVTVTANNDTDIEDAGGFNDQLSLTTTSTNANFDALVTSPILVSVVDNDGGLGVLVVQSSGTTDVNETTNTFTQSGGIITALGAGTDSYTIVLTKAPTANVVVNCLSNGQLSINGAPTISSTTNQTTAHSTTFTTGATTRTFSAANWNVPQTVVVRGNQDTTSEGPHTGTVTHTITTASGGYPTTLPIQQVVPNIVDDDNSIIVTHSNGETRVMEGDEVTDTITVRLRTIPNAAVSVNLGGNRLKFNPAILTFNPSGTNLWSTDQTVTVSAADGYIKEGIATTNIIAYSTSSGTNYNGTTAPTMTATIIDNDDARLVINESGGNTLVNEDGTNDTYTLALGRRPKVGTTTTVTLVPSSTGIQVSPVGPIVFNENNWNTPVTITVSTTNDGTAETRGTATITHNITSTDPTYNLSSTPWVLVTVDDNDPPLTIAQTNIFTQVKEGGTAGTGGTPNAQDTFTVVLPRAPATGTTVTVTLAPNNQVAVSPSVLTFTSATTGVGAYNIAQTVTVTAIDDTDVEATVHQGVIGFNVVSADSYYNGAQSPDVLVQVTDNDSPGISIVESGNTTSLTEGGTDSYTVVATQAPAAGQAVVIDLTSAPVGELLLSAVGTLTNCATMNGSKVVTTTNTTGLALALRSVARV